MAIYKSRRETWKILPLQTSERTNPAWLWTCSLQNCETITLFFKAHSGAFCYDSSGRLTKCVNWSLNLDQFPDPLWLSKVVDDFGQAWLNMENLITRWYFQMILQSSPCVNSSSKSQALSTVILCFSLHQQIWRTSGNFFYHQILGNVRFTFPTIFSDCFFSLFGGSFESNRGKRQRI